MEDMFFKLFFLYNPGTHTSLFADKTSSLARVPMRTSAWCIDVSCQVEPFEVVCCDLALCMRDRLRRQVDILVFNPPYVPTPPEEVGSM